VLAQLASLPTCAPQTCEGDQLRQLVHSLCPSIFGHELVKASRPLGLQLLCWASCHTGAPASSRHKAAMRVLQRPLGRIPCRSLRPASENMQPHLLPQLLRSKPAAAVVPQAGLLLALFGGVRKAPGAEGEMALRGDVHILMVLFFVSFVLHGCCFAFACLCVALRGDVHIIMVHCSSVAWRLFHCVC